MIPSHSWGLRLWPRSFRPGMRWTDSTCGHSMQAEAKEYVFRGDQLIGRKKRRAGIHVPRDLVAGSSVEPPILAPSGDRRLRLRVRAAVPELSQACYLSAPARVNTRLPFMTVIEHVILLDYDPTSR